MDSGGASATSAKIPDLLLNQEIETLRVLRGARALIHRDGWIQREFDLSPRERASAKGWALHFAIAEAAVNEEGRPTIAVEWARRVIRKLISHHSIPDWNDHPLRTKAEVLALLDRAIELSGGSAPRRGGWQIGGAR